ncbi:MAG: hypothetical protein IKJ06_00975 [Clostridia bacterium]|nr:hypothetical protein [Clostridia bacterium]
MKEWLTDKRIVALATIIFALFLVLTVFVFQYGVSDNGDLTGRLLHLGLYDSDGASGSGGYAFKFGVGGKVDTLTTADIPYALFTSFLPKDSFIPVLIPATIYILLLVAGFYLIIKNLISKYKWNNILLAVFAILILGDVGYTAFLNTPYVNAAVFSYLVLTIGAFLWSAREEESKKAIVFAGISAVLFAGSSRITAWCGIVLALLFIRMIFVKKNAIQKILCAIFSLLIVFSSVYGLANIKTSDSDKYNSIFYGVALNNSEEATKLGFDNETANLLSGTSAFEQKALDFMAENDISETVSPLDVAGYYAKNLSNWTLNMKQVAQNSTMISTGYLGYFKSSSSKLYQQPKLFNLYGTLKRRIIPANFYILSALLLAFLAGTIFYRKKYAISNSSKLVCDALICLVPCTFIAFFLPLIYTGFAQISFAMHLFNLLFDICVLSAITGGTKLLWIRREALKEKFGVNQ